MIQEDDTIKKLPMKMMGMKYMKSTVLAGCGLFQIIVFANIGGYLNE